MRIYAVEMTLSAKSGHPTSASSCADFISVSFFSSLGMKYDP